MLLGLVPLFSVYQQYFNVDLIGIITGMKLILFAVAYCCAELCTTFLLPCIWSTSDPQVIHWFISGWENVVSIWSCVLTDWAVCSSGSWHLTCSKTDDDDVFQTNTVPVLAKEQPLNIFLAFRDDTQPVNLVKINLSWFVFSLVTSDICVY